ncbi:MAG: tetratricopeptide repeat protein [Sulfurihydrogenibium sp.]|nr:tetratricopeptide repeat protein [Sulfurihydrogenibium sp.]
MKDFNKEVRGVYCLGEYTFEELIEYCKQSIERYPDSPDGYLCLGSAYYDVGEFDLAYEFLKKAASLEKEEDRLAYICEKIGFILFKKGDFDSALEYYERALELAERVYAIGIKFDAMVYTAYIYYVQGRIDESLDLYKKSLSFCRDKEFRFVIFSNIAFLHYMKKEYRKAIKFFEKAIEIGIQNGFYRRVLEARLDVANVYMDIGDYDTALSYISDVLTDAQKTGDKYIEARARWLLAKFCWRTGNDDFIMGNLEEAYDLFREIGEDEEALKVLEDIKFVDEVIRKKR